MNADFINLAMIRVWGSQKVETILELVIKIIEDFGLAMEDIGAFVTDGASIMLKLGRLAPCEHIVCLSHTMHLHQVGILGVGAISNENTLQTE